MSGNLMAKARNFETSLARLAEIVEALENDGTSLNESMKLYEEGIALSQACRRELEQAELRITELRARAEGGFEENDLEM
jgi:exodeoxyribonuclease VII small subunit